MERRPNIEPNGQMYFWSDLPTIQRTEGSTSLYNIHSDDGNRLDLELQMLSVVYGDIFVSMGDKIPDDNWQHFKSIRLRSLVGGGLNPFITESFVSILSYYNNGLQEFPTTEKQTRERINSNSQIIVKRDEKEEPRLSIVGIQDDDGDSWFLDILVLQNGDVKLRVREEPDSNYPDEQIDGAVGEMLFKTKENGGKNPFIATALTRLAEKIANAKRS